VTWLVELGPIRRTIEKLDPAVRRRVLVALLQLETDPLARGTVKPRGSDRLYRRRVGDWRIVFTIDHSAQTVTVAQIDHRREVYRRPRS
jgi:mRNA interferase RelE/StbE